MKKQLNIWLNKHNKKEEEEEIIMLCIPLWST